MIEVMLFVKDFVTLITFVTMVLIDSLAIMTQTFTINKSG